MLDLITKSKIRKNIIRLLFANPDEEFYLSEIAKKINASVGTCRRELSKMAKSGILKFGKKANLVFYSINKQSPVFRELAAIVNKTIGIDAEIKKMIQDIKGVKFAFIFGSYVQKKFTADSDIDLFLIGKINESQLLKKLRPLENILGREINYHLYGEKDFRVKFKTNSFLKNIIKDCLLLTNNQDEFRKLLK